MEKSQNEMTEKAENDLRELMSKDGEIRQLIEKNGHLS
jgi:uncharacterized protein YgiM (DUF1202 family)